MLQGFRAAREELARALEYVREGDTFMVTRLDRLARSMIDLRQIVDELNRKDVAAPSSRAAFDTTRSDGRQDLVALAAAAQQAELIRALVDRVRQRLNPDAADEALQWIKWAERVADSLDPLTNGTLQLGLRSD